jgi:hypothetical protein
LFIKSEALEFKPMIYVTQLLLADHLFFYSNKKLFALKKILEIREEKVVKALPDNRSMCSVITHIFSASSYFIVSKWTD